MINVRISEVMMLTSNNERTIVKTCRKPRISEVNGGRKIITTMSKDAMIARKKAVVVSRPAQAEMQASLKQASQSGMQMQASSSKQPSNHPGTIESPSRVNRRLTQQSQQMQSRQTAQELKQTAIQQAMNIAMKKEMQQKKKKHAHVHFGLKRVLLAATCAAVAVFAIVYFVNLSAPNISLKVAAMQSGIEASYPAYVPRDFSLSDITSENGKITLNFKNTAIDAQFTLVEEKSSWDSNALLNNFVVNEYGDNYTLIREQGLALYISGSNAAWVNGGVVYKIESIRGSLTKKQIKSIAVSL